MRKKSVWFGIVIGVKNWFCRCSRDWFRIVRWVRSRLANYKCCRQKNEQSCTKTSALWYVIKWWEPWVRKGKRGEAAFMMIAKKSCKKVHDLESSRGQTTIRMTLNHDTLNHGQRLWFRIMYSWLRACTTTWDCAHKRVQTSTMAKAAALEGSRTLVGHSC